MPRTCRHPARSGFVRHGGRGRPSLLAEEEALIAVNSAVEVDLTGRVNAETLEHRYVGGVTGQPDFVRAAQRTPPG